MRRIRRVTTQRRVTPGRDRFVAPLLEAEPEAHSRPIVVRVRPVIGIRLVVGVRSIVRPIIGIPISVAAIPTTIADVLNYP
jgi:hypothetical protein